MNSDLARESVIIVVDAPPPVELPVTLTRALETHEHNTQRAPPADKAYSCRPRLTEDPEGSSEHSGVSPGGARRINGSDIN